MECRGFLYSGCGIFVLHCHRGGSDRFRLMHIDCLFRQIRVHRSGHLSVCIVDLFFLCIVCQIGVDGKGQNESNQHGCDEILDATDKTLSFLIAHHGAILRTVHSLDLINSDLGIVANVVVLKLSGIHSIDILSLFFVYLDNIRLFLEKIRSSMIYSFYRIDVLCIVIGRSVWIQKKTCGTFYIP